MWGESLVFPQHVTLYRIPRINCTMNLLYMAINHYVICLYCKRVTCLKHPIIYLFPGATPKAIHLVKLDPVEILIKIRNETNQGPVTFKNHAADSAINEVTLLGLHSDQTHVSIVEFSFDPQQLLHGTRRVVAKLPRIGNREVTGSITSVVEGKVRTVLTKLLLHMQVFYCKSFIEVEVELFDDTTPHEPPSSHHFDSKAYYTHTHFIMRPLVMAAIPDDDRILNNEAASALLLFPNPSPDMCEMDYSVISH